MNIYRVRRAGGTTGYDRFDAFVCVAASEDDARAMMPSFDYDAPPTARVANGFKYDEHEWSWPDGEPLVVDLVATEAVGPARVVLSSFNAG